MHWCSASVFVSFCWCCSFAQRLGWVCSDCPPRRQWTDQVLHPSRWPVWYGGFHSHSLFMHVCILHTYIISHSHSTACWCDIHESWHSRHHAVPPHLPSVGFVHVRWPGQRSPPPLGEWYIITIASLTPEATFGVDSEGPRSEVSYLRMWFSVSLQPSHCVAMSITFGL
jgi:hypothetical protein